MARARRRGRFGTAALSGALASAAVLAAGSAQAQQTTPHLDRLEVPGAPEDGLVLFRPAGTPPANGWDAQAPRTAPIMFGQLALGYSLNPLRTSNITSDRPTLIKSPSNIITTQLTQYTTFGFQFLDRIILAATLPVTWVEAGNQPVSATAATTTFSTSGPAVADTRIDFRGAFPFADKKGALGAGLSIFAPTGNGSTTNFGGDGGTSAMLMINGEYTIKWLTLVANTGLAFRPENAINHPELGNGLGVGNEWRWAVGGFVPIKGGKWRLGATIFGQTGIGSDNIIGDTAFKSQNTPIEWNVEGRYHFKIGDAPERWWVGLGGGTLIANGYGAPDLRVVGMIGTYIPILDTDPNSPAAKLAMRREIKRSLVDTDHDGIPDEIDPCPTVPEDHKPPDPNDGCPAPQDRDKDGIPDDQDACPDTPGVFSTDPKKNGCPAPKESPDRDNDGIPNAQDACPDVPGKPSPDPKKNGCPTKITVDEGGTVRTLQNIEFATDSATILPSSFPILQEVVDLLNGRPDITKMRVEGHTDNVGPADYNLQLSKRRAASVMTWLTQHGIAQDRLESEGYGLTKPIADNNTEAGRSKNRRVEFKILVEHGQQVNQ